MAYEAYIDSAFYTDTYKGTAIDSTVFDRIALRASDEIDRLTFRHVRSLGLTAFSTDDQESIKLATSAIAEALAQIDAATDSTGILTTSETVGPYSYATNIATTQTLMNAAKAQAKSYLMSTGLLYAGLGYTYEIN